MSSIIIFMFWLMVLRNFWGWFFVTNWRWSFLLNWLWNMSFGTWLILWLVKWWSLLHWLNARSFSRNLCALSTKCCSGLLGNVRDALNYGPSIFLDNTCINEADFLFELFLGSFHTLSWTQTAPLCKRLLNQFILTTFLNSGSIFISSFDRTNLIVDWWLIIVNLRSICSVLIIKVLDFDSLLIEFLQIPFVLVVKGYVVVFSVVILWLSSQNLIVTFLQSLWSKC